MTKSIILLLILTGVTLFGQESNIFKELGIKQIEEYVYDISPSLEFKDSILWKEVVLDSLGRIEWQKGRDVLGNVFEFKHYYSGGKLKEIRKISRGDKTERMHEAFKYNRNGQLKVVKRYVRGSMRGKSFYKFDAKNRIRERVVKNFTYTKKEKYVYLYNEKGQKIREHSTRKDAEDLEFEYDDNGNEIFVHRINKEKGKQFYLVKEYDDENRIIKLKEYCSTKNRLPDASIVIVAEKGDIWIRKFEYDNRGLPVEIKQWLNNKLVGIKRIRYSEK